ncbi:MAG TPA: N-acetylneuraminate synthase [Candidatus Scalindua sp.]|nr:N-acetylneuraminate synthase [Candidatus Scalindua sp.]
MSNVLILGEIGINHNGSLAIAKKLIDMAKECGCDAVKFQKRTIDKVYTREFLNSPRESPWGTTQGEQKRALELTREDYDEIDKYCKEKNIFWFASAWDYDSQVFLRKYNLSFNKIASAMLTNKEFVKIVASERRQLLVSTGGSTMAEVSDAVAIIKEQGCPFVLMHCVSLYPCPDKLCNINMVAVLQKKFGGEVGYSGHELGIVPSILAVASGATVIERHITLNRADYGSDQAASLEKRGLELLVRDARQVRAMLGNGSKNVSPEELKNINKMRYWR